MAALNFQAAGRGPNLDSNSKSESHGGSGNGAMSDNIWSSLRLALSLMGRRDLYPYLDDRNLERINDMLSKT